MLLYSVIRPYVRRAPRSLQAVAAGALFAAIAAVAMHAPIVVTPGIRADGRVIVVALVAPFAGPVAGLTTGALVSAYRLWLGGVGTAAGVGTIVTAAAIGIVVERRWGRRARDFGPRAFLLLGLVLDAVLLGWALALPNVAMARDVLMELTVPVGLWVPVGTMLLGALLVHEHRQNEERERLTLTQFAMDHAADAVVWLGMDGRFVDANPAALALAGRTRDALLGARVWDVDRSITVVTWPARWAEVAARHSVVQESVYRRPDGSAVPVEIAYNFLRYEDREWISAFVRDISERKRAELERDQFLSTLSHELRTPLTSILGYTRILRKGGSDPGRAVRALDAIERNSRMQAEIVDDLLDVSRLVAGQLEIEPRPLELSSVVDDAVSAARPAADQKGVALNANRGDGARVVGDAARLQQAIGKLLDNAIKFTPEGGRVEVKLARGQDEAAVVVRDTGEGISPEFLPRVFERFRQADSSLTRTHGGLGLGLTIVRHVAERHGGRVSAHSEGPGQGATFTLTVPLA
jgi:PAS domain S-box-containing protein